MNRTEFIVATAVILFVAFLVGWFSHWLVHRFTRIGQSQMEEVDRLAQQLHEAEEARDEAILWFEQRETVLQANLDTAEAELKAAIEALDEARAEAEELRAYVETANAG